MLNLSKEAIERANSASNFDAGTSLAREAESVYLRGVRSMESPDGIEELSERQQAILADRLVSWRELVEKSYNDIIARRGSWMPWTVCGPARYDQQKNEERADRQLKAAAEWSEKMDRFVENTIRMIREAIPPEQVIAEYRSGKRHDAISADDPHAAEKLEARIAYLKEYHEDMKARNAWWRKHSTMKGFPGMSDEAAEKADSVLNDPQNIWRVPFAPYELQLSTANIKRLEDRLKAISSRAQGGEKEYVMNGFTVRITSDCRINVTFDEKPEEEARSILKGSSFHWSPREKVWTRKATANALHEIRYCTLPALRALDAYREDGCLTLDEFAEKYV